MKFRPDLVLTMFRIGALIKHVYRGRTWRATVYLSPQTEAVRCPVRCYCRGITESRSAVLSSA